MNSWIYAINTSIISRAKSESMLAVGSSANSIGVFLVRAEVLTGRGLDDVENCSEIFVERRGLAGLRRQGAGLMGHVDNLIRQGFHWQD